MYQDTSASRGGRRNRPGYVPKGILAFRGSAEPSRGAHDTGVSLDELMMTGSPRADACLNGAMEGRHYSFHNVLVTSAGEYEYGAFLEAKNDGMFGAHGGEIHSNYSKTYAILPGLPDYSNVLGTVHNHLWSNDTEDPWRNHIDRYPGPEDWAGLDQLVSPPPGVPPADPSRLSVYLTDPWGTTREFRYSDRATYEAMSDDDRRLGNNLPDEVEDCPEV